MSYTEEDLKQINEHQLKQLPFVLDAAEMLWVCLANVSGGDWSKQTPEWQKAAKKWRDNYFKVRASL